MKAIADRKRFETSLTTSLGQLAVEQISQKVKRAKMAQSCNMPEKSPIHW